MSQNGNAVAGVTLTGSAVTTGVTTWVTENATLLSLTFTALSCIAGIIFLFLNYRQTKRRNDILERQNK